MTTTLEPTTSVTQLNRDIPASSRGRETALVIRRELTTRAANRTILTSTAILALVVGGAAAAGGWYIVDSTAGGTFALDTNILFATAMISILLASLVYSGQSIATGVVEEKSSRVVEILLTKIGVVPLLAGKMIGIGLVTLAQLLVIATAGVVGFTLVDGWSIINIDPGPTALWFLLWFFLGYGIFAALNTALASTVARQEDLGTAVMPLTVLQMGLLIVSLYLVPENLESTWIEALSYVPLFSSYMMPMRFALDSASVWEMAAAAGIAAVAIPLVFALATRLYRNNALRTGSRVSLKESLTAQNSL